LNMQQVELETQRKKEDDRISHENEKKGGPLKRPLLREESPS